MPRKQLGISWQVSHLHRLPVRSFGHSFRLPFKTCRYSCGSCAEWWRQENDKVKAIEWVCPRSILEWLSFKGCLALWSMAGHKLASGCVTSVPCLESVAIELLVAGYWVKFASLTCVVCRQLTIACVLRDSEVTGKWRRRLDKQVNFHISIYIQNGSDTEGV